MASRPTCEVLEPRRLMSLTVYNVSVTPTGLTPGPHDTLWTSDTWGSTIVRMDPNGHVRQFKLPSSHRPTVLTAGPDGNMWFIDNGGSKIGRISFSGGARREFRVPGKLTALTLAAGPDGNIWFLANDTSHDGLGWYIGERSTLGSISHNGRVHEFPLTALGDVRIGRYPSPGGLSVGVNGTLDFTANPNVTTALHLPDELVQCSTRGQVLNVTPNIPPPQTLAPDGNTYRVIAGGIARVNADSTTTLVAPTTLPVLELFAGPFAKLWFIDTIGDIGFLNDDGTLTYGRSPDGSLVRGVVPAATPNALWLEANDFERFDPTNSILVRPQTSTVTPGTAQNLTLATFNDFAPDTKVSNLTAAIDWSDGTSSQGTITQNSDGTFTLTAIHPIAQNIDGQPSYANFTILDRATTQSAKGQALFSAP